MVIPNESENLTLPEAAKFVRVSTRTLQRLISLGEGPRCARVGQRRLIFRVRDLQRWIDQRARC